MEGVNSETVPGSVCPVPRSQPPKSAWWPARFSGWLTLAAWLSACVPLLAGEVVRLQRATDVVQQWQPGRRLFVKGELGLGADRLQELAGWLDQHATNWVVLLADTAQGEAYTDNEGHQYNGFEAINHAMGKGLVGQTAFGRMTDPRTQELDAAFFALALRDRKFSYFGSDAQDRRGLGEDRWQGNLDQPAIKAMRQGGRIVDAVEQTVANINLRLDERIAAEVRGREEKARAEQQARTMRLEQARAARTRALETISRVEAEAGNLARKLPNANGDLVRPDSSRWVARLKGAETQIEAGDASVPEAVQREAESQLATLARHEADTALLQDLARQFDALSGRPGASALKARLSATRQTLQAVLQEHARAESTYAAHLDAAKREVPMAAMMVEAAERAARQRQWALGLSATTLLGMVVLLGLFLNRRRAGVKRDAEVLCATWEKGMQEKSAALFNLLDEREGLVGRSADEAAGRYAGETLRVCEQVIKDVDELFIMSACVGRILTEAQACLAPAVVWGRLANLFLKRRFLRAQALLHDEPIAFRPEEALDLVVRGPRTERDRLAGKLANYQPFRMTFSELINAFNERAERALDGLEELRDALSTVADKLDHVEAAIGAAAKTAVGLAERSRADGLFALASLEETLLPGARTALAEARKTAVRDPLGCLKGAGRRAAEQAAEAQSLAEAFAGYRGERLSETRQGADSLSAAGLPVDWIASGLSQMGEQADELARKAAEHSQAEALQTFLAACAAWFARVQSTVALNQRRQTELAPQLADVAAAIDQTRQELGRRLGLEPARLLREADNDPSAVLEQAREQERVCAAGLGRGDVAGAQSACEAAFGLLERGRKILEATRLAADQHAATEQALTKEADRLEGLVPERREVLAGLMARYRPNVLLLGDGDPTHPRANGTIADNLEETLEATARARALVRQSREAYLTGALLASSARHEEARGTLALAEHRLAEVSEKQARLARTETDNAAALTRVTDRLQRNQAAADQPAITRPTLSLLAAATERLARLRQEGFAEPLDPFATAAELAGLDASLAELEQHAVADRAAMEEALRSVQTAARRIDEAERLSQAAATDGVADSDALRAAMNRTAQLRSTCQALSQQVGVAHGDWTELDRQADQLGNDAASVVATLRRELEQAQAAIRALNTAADLVRSAGRWRGGFGVLVAGDPGSRALAQARGLLDAGQYLVAIQIAESARAAAEAAIREAQMEVMRRQRAEEERQAAERRRRQMEEQARHHHDSSSSWGGSSSSWGSSGSGASSSSFSSGSGASTSSW